MKVRTQAHCPGLIQAQSKFHPNNPAQCPAVVPLHWHLCTNGGEGVGKYFIEVTRTEIRFSNRRNRIEWLKRSYTVDRGGLLSHYRGGLFDLRSAGLLVLPHVLLRRDQADRPLRHHDLQDDHRGHVHLRHHLLDHAFRYIELQLNPSIEEFQKYFPILKNAFLKPCKSTIFYL